MRRLLVVLAGLVVVAGCGEERAAEAPVPEAAGEPATRTQEDAEAPRARGSRLVRSSGGPRVTTVGRGLVVPWDIAFLPDGRALVTERGGTVRLISSKRRLQRAPVARVRVSAQGEGGLLGVAVDPDWARGRRFAYLYATTANGMQVQRWRWTGARLVRSAVILGDVRAGAIHDSGRLRFGPDERLYVATGDAGQGALSQQRSSRNGKILRLSKRQYRGSRPARPTIYSLGHRNPQGLDWQPRTNRLFTTDHGPSGFDGGSGLDEINVVTRGSNHGWPVARGREHGSFDAPVQLYVQAIAPSGLAFLSSRGSSWTGDLFVAALRGRVLRHLEVQGAQVVSDEPLFAGRFGRLRAVVEAPDGTLWITTSNRDGRGDPAGSDDRILRVIPPRA